MEMPAALTPCTTPAWFSSALCRFGSAPPPRPLPSPLSTTAGLASPTASSCSLEVQPHSRELSGFRLILENCEAEPKSASLSYQKTDT